MKVGELWTFQSATTVTIEGEADVEDVNTGELITLREGETYWWPNITFKVIAVRRADSTPARCTGSRGRS
jgi:hypothetical protein